MKIFAIDDEIASLYFLSQAIKEVCPDDELKQFSNYKDFVEAFKKDMPEIVFLDIEMPGIDGLKLAEMIKEIKSDVNIIYVTAYSQYAIEAFKLNASSYIVKPVSKESIINAMNNLRYEINKQKDILIKTFGNFDIFYKGIPVKFRSEKSKEILAYLVDRQGGLISKKELGAIIYEDDYSNSIQAILSRNIKYLEEDLINAGIKDFLYIEKGGYYLDLEKSQCDLVDYLQKGDVKFFGEYMEQYSWGEYRKYSLK